jgi:hypothetical protein
VTQIGILQVYAGKNIPAIQRIKIFSPEEWEEFVEEWLTTKKSLYDSIERLGGAGDKGRDVVGYLCKPVNNNYMWENYQCKHYSHPLMPSDVWSEFGKLCYYTYINDFPVPSKYYFVAPCGIGTSLSSLLNNPIKLKKELIKNWDRYCKKSITKKKDILLDNKFLYYINNFDFSIFEKITPLNLIEEHYKTKFHSVRFGGGMPARPSIPIPPKVIHENELPYIKCLLTAYGSDSDEECVSVAKLNSRYVGHLNRSRESFYSAEQLKMFSRDSLPTGVFEQFKEEIYTGIVDIYEDNHSTGFKRVKSVEQEARRLSITSNALVLCSTIKDRSGICHHLANEGTFKWVEEEK